MMDVDLSCLPGLQLREAMAQVGLPPEIFFPIVKRFAVVNQDVVARLQAANHGKDLAQLREISHTLKGASAGIGAVELQDCCLDLEIAAHHGASLDEISQLLSLLEQELARVLTSISSLP